MGPPPNALSTKTAEAINSIGRAVTQNELQAMFPDATRPQLQKALSNARARGLIRCVQKGIGGRGGRDVQSSIWAPLNETALVVTSVWDLAEPKAAMPTITGRQCFPLGDWPEYQPRNAT